MSCLLGPNSGGHACDSDASDSRLVTCGSRATSRPVRARAHDPPGPAARGPAPRTGHVGARLLVGDVLFHLEPLVCLVLRLGADVRAAADARVAIHIDGLPVPDVTDHL